MLKHPLSARLRYYSGRDDRKRRQIAEFNETAHKLVDYVNAEIAKSPNDIVQMEYHSIAQHFRLTTDAVSEVFQEMGGGHNGITVAKR